MESLLKQVNSVLENESAEWRPIDSEERPGGMILLRGDLPTIIVPDLHGRNEYLPDLMRFVYRQKPVYELLKSEEVQVVCVGDGMHGERRVAGRWRTAFEEFKNGFKECPAMAEEMTENFQTMAKVMRLKVGFPRLFHFLKGNHENILDENINGNHPFAKLAAEGSMTRYYMEKFYGVDFLNQYDRFEKNLPLLARGDSFLISHARPKRAFRYREVIEYRSNPELVEGLTWTRSRSTGPSCIEAMLREMVGNGGKRSLLFSGHNAITEPCRVREDESLVEIHNPNLRTIVILEPLVPFDADKHVSILPSPDKDD
ncbi:MAG: hypothetical protein GY866_28140 [Proteobacteria bacterium]|nr:hypothetical protein [Pseudomonadota bacterium]